MKAQAVCIVKLAIAGKFAAALFFCPFLALCQQLRGIPLFPVFFGDENAFQIADGRALRSLHIVMPQLALRKSDRLIIHIFDKAGGFLILHQFTELFCHILLIMIRPHLDRQICKYSGILRFCSLDHILIAFVISN